MVGFYAIADESLPTRTDLDNELEGNVTPRSFTARGWKRCLNWSFLLLYQTPDGTRVKRSCLSSTTRLVPS